MNSIGILPTPDRDSEHYWAALAEGRLELQHCLDCGHWTWPPRPICSNCHGENFEWRAVAGTGEVFSWVITHQVYGPTLAALVPYTVALVRLDEQADLLIPGRLVSDVDAHAGLRVHVVLEKVADGIGVLAWEADAA